MSIENIVGVPVPTQIVGEIEAGQAAKVRKQVAALIKSITTSEFDIMDLLYEIKEKKYYQPKFNTYSEYAKTFEAFGESKALYLVKIKRAMVLAGIERTAYEQAGISKLRAIARLNPETHKDEIGELVELAKGKTVEDLKIDVANCLGLTGDDQEGWLNVSIRLGARKIVVQAIEKMKMHIGSVAQDSEGTYIDASEGRCLEMIAANFLADPNFENNAVNQN